MNCIKLSPVEIKISRSRVGLKILDNTFIEIATVLSIVATVEEVTKATIDMQHEFKITTPNDRYYR